MLHLEKTIKIEATHEITRDFQVTRGHCRLIENHKIKVDDCIVKMWIKPLTEWKPIKKTATITLFEEEL